MSELLSELLEEAVELFEDNCGVDNPDGYAWRVNARAALNGVCVLCEYPAASGACANPGCCFREPKKQEGERRRNCPECGGRGYVPCGYSHSATCLTCNN